jgi:predicted dehydrogenase
MKRPIRFALIGCGRIIKNHAAAIIETPDASLVGVSDLDPQRMEAAARKWDVPGYLNYHDLIRDQAPDVVGILTPSGMHPAHVIDVINRYRVHVSVEKPMALSAHDLQAIETCASHAGVTVFPVYQNRYNRAVQFVRSAIASGVLGKLVLGTARVRWSRGQQYYDRDPWRGTWAMDGGALTNQGIHYLDLLQYLGGDISWVRARTATSLVSVEVEDTALGMLGFHNGALGAIEVTTAARPRDFEAEISLLCEKGTVILGGLACNEIRTFTPDESQASIHSEDFPDAYGFGHWPFYSDVVSQCQRRGDHPISFVEGCKAVRLLNALYRSAETQADVRLDGDVASSRLGTPDRRLASLYTSVPSGERHEP